MNSYLITDMPGTPRSPRVGSDEVRFTSLNRAILFYDELCSDLLAFTKNEDVYRYFTADGQHIVHTFTNAERQCDLMKCRVKTEHDKRKLLQRYKTMLHQLLGLYRNCDLGTTDAPDIAKWRWVKLRERAEKWQQTADTHDWSHRLNIEPKIWSEPWWGGFRPSI